MKTFYIFFLIPAIWGGTLVLDASDENLEQEWTPLVCPYPGSGLQIKDSITITKATQYQLEIELPDHLSSEIGLPEKFPMDCVLHVKIISDSVKHENTVKKFEYEGQIPAELVSLYSSDQQWDLNRGEYEVEISSEKTPSLISTNGAILKLEQIKNPVGPIVRNKLQWYGGMLLIILSILGLIAVVFKNCQRSK